MAKLSDISFTYDDLDEVWPLIFGDHPDITAAFYNGDYTKSLQQAQRDKHEWILEGMGFKPGYRILDIGCGWGPLLSTIKEKGGEGVGLTLSPKQADTCNHHGLKVFLRDWKEVDLNEIGKFDATVSIGAFEHFCSIDEYLQGKQEAIYTNFFKFCHDLLPENGMLYLQTMIWGECVPWVGRDPTVADLDKYLSLKAPKKSDVRMLGYIRAFFPGSWLPKNKEQIISTAEPYFDLVKANNGRLDYIQTLTEWEKAWHTPNVTKRLFLAKLWLRYIFEGQSFRARVGVLQENAVREVFIRHLFDHQRIFFKKK